MLGRLREITLQYWLQNRNSDSVKSKIINLVPKYNIWCLDTLGKIGAKGRNSAFIVANSVNWWGYVLGKSRF